MTGYNCREDGTPKEEHPIMNGPNTLNFYNRITGSRPPLPHVWCPGTKRTGPDLSREGQ